MSDIGRRIKERRNELRLSQAELAEKLGYKDKSSIAKIEAGSSDIYQKQIVDFASALDTSVSYLMGWDDKPTLSYADELIKEYPVLERLLYAGGKALQVNEPLVMAVIQALEACDNATKK